MKFFIQSTAIVLALALCAQSVPTQENGQQAEVANQKTEQDARLWSQGDDEHKESKFTDEGCYQNDIKGLAGQPLLTPVDYSPTVTNQDCYEYCEYQGKLNPANVANYFGLTIWEGGPVAKNDYIVCNCYKTFTTSTTTPAAPAPPTGASASCLLDRGRIVLGLGGPLALFNVDTVELFSITTQ
jgi:hypothetical protein